MENQSISTESFSLEIPAFKQSPRRVLEINKTKEGEKRLIEAKNVTPITFSDLEYCFNEAYRELSKHASIVTYEIAMAEKAMEVAKSTFLLDKYPDLIGGKPKSQDSADMRKAYLMRDQEYVDAMDRIARLKAMEAYINTRIKLFEKVCSHMRKKMDLIIRSGLSNPQLYQK